MGLYKEEHHWLLEQFKKQKQIYNDACDHGVVVSGVFDPYCDEVRQVLFEDSYLFSSIKKHRTGEVTNRQIGVSIKLYLPWEGQGDNNSCTEWNIHYVDDLVRKVRFISFDHRPVGGIPEKDIWEEANGK